MKASGAFTLGAILGFTIYFIITVALNSIYMSPINTVHYKEIYDNNWSYKNKYYDKWVLIYEHEQALEKMEHDRFDK